MPNGQATSNPIVNHSKKSVRRCIIGVGISYDDDIDHAFEVMREILTADPRAKADPPAWFGVTGLGESSVDIEGRVWVQTDQHRVFKAEMTKLIKEAFDREGIEIPYPQAVEFSKGELAQRSPPIKPKPAIAQQG